MTNLSEKFQEKLTEGGVFVAIGNKASGKSSLTLAILRAALEDRAFNRYVLILPSFQDEASGSYNWVAEAAEELRGSVEMTIYDEWDPLIAEQIVTAQRAEPDKRLFLWIDDATAFARHLGPGATDKNWFTILSQARHVNVTTFLAVHNLKKVLSPTLRESVNFFMMSSHISCRKTLEAIWEEYLSLTYPRFVEFLEALWFPHAARDFGFLTIDTSTIGSIDEDILEWGWIKQRMAVNLALLNKHSNSKTQNGQIATTAPRRKTRKGKTAIGPRGESEESS